MISPSRFERAVFKQVIRLRAASLDRDACLARRVAQLCRKRREYHGRGRGWVYAQLQANADHVVRLIDGGREVDLSEFLDRLCVEYPEIALLSWMTEGATIDEARMMLFLNDGEGNWSSS